MLDGLRLLAALAVILFHFTARFPTLGWGESPFEMFPLLAPISSYGMLGVQLFFIISGFVILLSAWGRDVTAFASSRVARLFPAYWVAVLATGLLLPAISEGLRDGKSLGEVLVNLTMLQDAFGVSRVDGVYWTLWVELCFYLLMALILLRGVTARRITVVAIVWPLAGMLAEALRLGFVAELLQPVYAPLFAGGMMLFLIYRCGHSALRWSVLAGNIALAVLHTITRAVPTTNGQLEEPISAPIAAIAVAALFGLVIFATLSPWRGRGGRVADWAGRITYPLYLIHQYWGLLVITLLYPVIGKWPALIAAVIAVVLAAMLIHRLVETPLSSRMRRGTDRGLRALAAGTRAAAARVGLRGGARPGASGAGPTRTGILDA